MGQFWRKENFAKPFTACLEAVGYLSYKTENFFFLSMKFIGKVCEVLYLLINQDSRGFKNAREKLARGHKKSWPENKQ